MAHGLSENEIEALESVVGADATRPTLALDCFFTTATTGCCGGTTFIC